MEGASLTCNNTPINKRLRQVDYWTSVVRGHSKVRKSWIFLKWLNAPKNYHKSSSGITSRQTSVSSMVFTIMIVIFSQIIQVQAFGELSGWYLDGCATVEVPYTYVDENRRSGFGGVAINYLDRLQDNLQFRFDLKLWNGTWLSLIDHMSNCNPVQGMNDSCFCDIGVGPFALTNENVEKVNFIWSFGHEDMRMATRKSELRVDDSLSTWFVFQTFSKKVWLIIGLGVLMHAIGTIFFGPFRTAEQWEGIQASRGSRVWWRLTRVPISILFSYAHLIGHPFQDGQRRTPSFHRTAWIVLGLTAGLFLMIVYEASLTVLLFESTKTSVFRTLDDITGCAVDPAKIAMIEGSSAQELWNLGINTSVHRMKCGWTTTGITVRDLEQGFQFLKQKKVDYFFDLEGSVLFRAHRNCDIFQAVGEPFYSTSVGFILPKRSNASQDFLQRVLSRETR